MRKSIELLSSWWLKLKKKEQITCVATTALGIPYFFLRLLHNFFHPSKHEIFHFILESVILMITGAFLMVISRLTLLCNVDALTGLYNKRYISKATIDTMQRAIRYGVAIVCVVIDVKNFKEINDVLGGGHLGGDEVLIELAERLQHNFRGDDIIIRFGGDEFVIYSTTSDPEYFVRLLDKKLAPFEVNYNNKIVNVVLTYGVEFEQDVEKFYDMVQIRQYAEKLYQRLFAAADLKMYKMKQKQQEEEEELQKKQ